MAKQKQFFICNSCGSDFSKWQGKCPHCNEWNSIVEVDKPSPKKNRDPVKAEFLSSIKSTEVERFQTDLKEFNLVCGGGIVSGSVILIGGDPGIGKSTIALQVASSMDTLYISGEESPLQIKNRAERINTKNEKIKISTNTIVEDIVELSEKEKPQCLIVDSIQTICSSESAGIAGSVSQIRESASILARMAKKTDITIILIGHITKDGSIAGPKLLEHLVDTVLYFESDFSREYRILRSFKNRFGSVNEIGLFQMTGKGLVEVKDKNRVFINNFSSDTPGSTITVSHEGSRTILYEVQSLVTFTNFSNPRRMADGFDLNRLILMIAVLEKHAGLKLSSFDVFINISRGFQINEPSADLAITMAIASSIKNKPIDKTIGLLGEISLSGEIRPVSQCQRRIIEFKNSGFKTILIPNADLKESEKLVFKGTIIGVKNIDEAINYLF